ncbi:putative serine/threonine-protein kinase PBL19 [Wolffia australiana]
MNCLRFLPRRSNERQEKQSTATPPQSVHTAVSCEINKKPSFRSIDELCDEKIGRLRIFHLAELRGATNGFSRRMMIGLGGFGHVYYGFIKPSDPKQRDKIKVAIKKLNRESLQGDKEWTAEIQFLSMVDHPNVVNLLGYCGEDNDEGSQRLLVYEFMANGSLDEHLFTRAFPSLSWKLRTRIALGVAQGLRYLHEELPVQVIYRDFKASNVLLDENFTPKLADFGMARMGPQDGRTHVTTTVVGTEGYVAPEYLKTGHLTSKSDVWSFGVVLFEMLTGRQCYEPARPKSDRKLLDWLKTFPLQGRRLRTIMDPRLENQYSVSAARSIATLAHNCLSSNPNSRPTMSQIVECLKACNR